MSNISGEVFFGDKKVVHQIALHQMILTHDFVCYFGLSLVFNHFSFFTSPVLGVCHISVSCVKWALIVAPLYIFVLFYRRGKKAEMG